MIPTIEKEQRQFDMRPKHVLSFELSALDGQFDDDVQALVSTARQLIGEAKTAYDDAIAAVRTNAAAKTLAEWEALQPAGRRLTDLISTKANETARAGSTLQSMYSEFGEKEMAVIRAEGAHLDPRPTAQEITAHMERITKATAALTKARTDIALQETGFRALKGELEQLQRELAAHEARENKLAERYKAVTGSLPGYRPAKITPNPAQHGNAFGLQS
jgi:chromosome segregation ATPase